LIASAAGVTSDNIRIEVVYKEKLLKTINANYALRELIHLNKIQLLAIFVCKMLFVLVVSRSRLMRGFGDLQIHLKIFINAFQRNLATEDF